MESCSNLVLLSLLTEIITVKSTILLMVNKAMVSYYCYSLLRVDSSEYLGRLRIDTTILGLLV